jgi:hypothetical protein
MDRTDHGRPAPAGPHRTPPEQPGPPRALLAGEEERGDEPHIERGID